MIVQIHRPALWEGACRECTGAYRVDPESVLEAARYGRHLTIDQNLLDLFARYHEGGHE